MSDEDSKNRFYTYYEQYQKARLRADKGEARVYALPALTQIHQIVGGPDQTKANDVMHELMGLVLTKEQTGEMYLELRRDSEIGG
jgi:hypothetical protein